MPERLRVHRLQRHVKDRERRLLVDQLVQGEVHAAGEEATVDEGAAGRDSTCIADRRWLQGKDVEGVRGDHVPLPRPGKQLRTGRLRKATQQQRVEVLLDVRRLAGRRGAVLTSRYHHCRADGQPHVLPAVLFRDPRVPGPLAVRVERLLLDRVGVPVRLLLCCCQDGVGVPVGGVLHEQQRNLRELGLQRNDREDRLRSEHGLLVDAVEGAVELDVAEYQQRGVPALLEEVEGKRGDGCCPDRRQGVRGKAAAEAEAVLEAVDAAVDRRHDRDAEGAALDVEYARGDEAAGRAAQEEHQGTGSRRYGGRLALLAVRRH